VAAKLGNNWPAAKEQQQLAAAKETYKTPDSLSFLSNLGSLPFPFIKIAPTQHKLYMYFNIIADATQEKQAGIVTSPRDYDGMAFNGTDSTHHHKLWRDVRGQSR
jgi:hypothetical protein